MCSVVKQQMLTKNNQDAREAWVLRAGAELWKAVIAEAESPAEDTQEALAAVRAALYCARRLRGCPQEAAPEERRLLSAECARAADAQLLALRQWGQKRGQHWDEDWGTQWGEALLPAPAEFAAPETAPRLLKCR